VTTAPSHAAPRSQTRQIWRLLGKNAGVRILVLPVSAILGIVCTRLIIDHFGQAAYAQYGLLVGIGALLPFADLGISAAIMNAVSGSDDPAADPYVHRVLTTAIRILTGSMSVLLLITVGISVSGIWSNLLGEGLIPHSGPIAAALCLTVIAVTLTVGFGQRILAGLGQNHVAIALLGLQTPVVLVALILIIQLHLHGGAYIAVIPYIATFAISVLATYLASRRLRPAVGLALRDAPKLRTVRGGKVFDVAWPMLLQMIALPIAMQTDRLILSHVSDLKQLSEYTLASQMYTPVWQVVNSAGLALWPIFAKARIAKNSKATSPMSLAVGFGGAAALCCVVISLASPWLSARASGGEIKLNLGLLVTFSIFMVLQATKYPLGMYMTDARGLRYQAYMIVLLLPVNLGLSWYLAIHIGAAGPVIGSAVGVFFCQVLANWIYVRRDLREQANS
jgi:O-antigen/teichoic acid export membrane protein